jgi:hypothetical protein
MSKILYSPGWCSDTHIWIDCKNVDSNVNTNFALIKELYDTMCPEEIEEICKVMLGVSD